MVWYSLKKAQEQLYLYISLVLIVSIIKRFNTSLPVVVYLLVQYFKYAFNIFSPQYFVLHFASSMRSPT